MNTHLFTPWSVDNKVRCHMQLNDSDNAKVKRGKWQGIVTDQLTKRMWSVRGASCGIASCYCDAEIVRELGD